MIFYIDASKVQIPHNSSLSVFIYDFFVHEIYRHSQKFWKDNIERVFKEKVERERVENYKI